MIRNILLVHAGRYGCRVQTTADSVSDEAELLVRGEYANTSPLIYRIVTLALGTGALNCMYVTCDTGMFVISRN